jgi:hypothetical protein
MQRKRILMTLAIAVGLAAGTIAESAQVAWAAPPPVRKQAKAPAGESCRVADTRYIPRTPVRFARRKALRQGESSAALCSLAPDVKQYPRTPRRTRPSARRPG